MNKQTPGPDTSELSFHTIENKYEGGWGDEGPRYKTKNDFAEEWGTMKIGGTRVPFSSGKTSKSSPPVTSAVINNAATAERNLRKPQLSPPFTCGICLGSVIEATLPLCGHMFCKSCVDECKERFRVCPICSGSLGDLVRDYEVDKIMEEYFIHASPIEERERFNAAKEKRIANLIHNLTLKKGGCFPTFRKEFELFRCRLRSKGTLRGSVATVKRFAHCIVIVRFSKTILILCGGICIGVVLAKFCSTTSRGGKFVNYWWNHILTGIFNYFTKAERLIEPKPEPGLFDSIFDYIRKWLWIPGSMPFREENTVN